MVYVNLLCAAGTFAAAGDVVGGVTDVAGTVGAAGGVVAVAVCAAYVTDADVAGTGGAAGVVGNSSPNQVRHFLVLLQPQSEAGPSFA